MKKALYFFQYLAPWKIDVFNGIAGRFDLTVVFFDIDREGFTYDRKDLMSRLKGVNVEILSRGCKVRGHPIRPGVRALLRKYRPDIVYVHEFSPVTVELLLLRRFFGYHLYLTTSDNLEMARQSSGFVRKVRNWVLGRVDGAIFYSVPVLEYYKNHFPGLKSLVCPNIQNPLSLLGYKDLFPPIKASLCEQYGIHSHRVALYIGRLTYVKGLDLLLNAWKQAGMDGYKLVLVGEGDCHDALKRQAEDLGIASDVIFPGFASGATLYAWYDIASFFILPSRYEPFGAVVNEALVFGCPVVASRYIGAVEFIQGENGFFFDPLSPDSFVEALYRARESFPEPHGPRPNLMPFSFESYLSAYFNIDDPIR